MRIASCFIALVATALFTANVRANTITARFTGVADGGVLVSPTLNGTPIGTGVVGVYQWTQTSGSPMLGDHGNFSTFCIELTQDIEFNQPPYQYSLVDLSMASQAGFGPSGMGAARADPIRELFGQDYSKVVDRNSAAEFQYAIWRVLYGTNFAVDAPNAGLMSVADAWVNGLNSQGPKADLIALASATAQDQVTVATPLPSAAWGGLVLLAAMGLWKVVGNRPVSCGVL